MRVESMRKKFPRAFANIKRGVYEDLRLQKKIAGVAIPEKFARVVAYNAAFFGAVELDRISSRKNNVVAGKTSNNTQSTAIAKIAASMEREVIKVKNGIAPMNLSIVSKWARQLRAL